jgi:hypothetical protein
VSTEHARPEKPECPRCEQEIKPDDPVIEKVGTFTIHARCAEEPKN